MASESFFGFDTRLPEDKVDDDFREPSSRRSGFGEVEDFPTLPHHELRGGHVPFPSAARNPDPLNDIWGRAADQLDALDLNDLIRSGSASASAARNEDVDGRPHLNSWDNYNVAGLGESEQRLSNTLSRLVDEESFNTGHIREDFSNLLEKLRNEESSPLGSFISTGKTTWENPFDRQPDLWSSGGSPAPSMPKEPVSSDRASSISSTSTSQTIVRGEISCAELEEIEGVKSSSSGPSLVGRSMENVSPPPTGLPFPPQQSNMHAERPDFFNLPRHIRPQPGMPMMSIPPGYPRPPAHMLRFPPGGVMPQRPGFGPFIRQPMHHGPGPMPPHMQRMAFGMNQMHMGRPPMGQMMVPPGFQRPGFRPQRHGGPTRVFNNSHLQPFFPPQIDQYDYEQEESMGWMTQREKEWVIKIQTQQLKTENPYLDDYYNSTYLLKKAGKLGAGDLGHDILLPTAVSAFEKEDRPNYFEGSLGKVCPSSVFNPRRTVAVEATDIAKNRAAPVVNPKRKWFLDPLQKDLGTPKQVLLGIEEGFTLIIKLQDCARELAALPPGKARDEQMDTKRDIANMLFARLAAGLNPDDRQKNFRETLKIPKGRELLRKSLPYLFKEQVFIIIGHLIKAIPVLLNFDKDEELLGALDKLVDGVKDVPLRRVVELIAPYFDGTTNWQGPDFAMLCSNKFLVNLFGLLIRCAEDIADKDYTEMESLEKAQWSTFVKGINTAIEKDTSDEEPLLREDLQEIVKKAAARFA